MTIVLRIVLIVVALCTFIFIGKKVRNAKVKLEDSIFWFCFAGVILIFSLFTQIFFWLSDMAGTMAPVNFVFLFFIFILLIQSFNLSMRISQADTKIKELTQQLAVEKFERYQNDHERTVEANDKDNVEKQSNGKTDKPAVNNATESEGDR